MSHVKTDKLSARTASGTITLGESGETFSLPSGTTLNIASGATISNAGTASGFGNNTPIFSALLSGTQSASASTWTKIQLNSIQTDTDTAWDAVNYRWTVPSGEGGKYLISGAILYKNFFANLNDRHVAIYKNGTEERRNFILDAGSGQCYWDCPTLVTILDLSVGDYIELYGYYTSSTASSIENPGTYLNINKLVE